MKNTEKLMSWLKNTPFEGVFLGKRNNFKWITEQNENAVVTNTEVGVAHLLFNRNGQIFLFADSSDCKRMEEEQNALNAECICVPWQETVSHGIEQYCEMHGGFECFCSDTGVANTCCLEEEIRSLRMELNEKEIERYREIGALCAEIVEQTAKEIRPGQTEAEVAAILKCRCIQNGVSPDCVLVGSDERILKYRHPVPTKKEIKTSAMVVLGGEKYGLNISMTRMVYFEQPSETIVERMKKTQYIFACMQGMMKHGMSYEQYFEKIKGLYKEAGYEEEWKKHHQGGPTGYECREQIAGPSLAGVLKNAQAYAWNPTIEGTKCEETTILHSDYVETLTRTTGWPCTKVTTEYGGFDVADILYVKN